jgi:hypothetical protein
VTTLTWPPVLVRSQPSTSGPRWPAVAAWYTETTVASRWARPRSIPATRPSAADEYISVTRLSPCCEIGCTATP